MSDTDAKDQENRDPSRKSRVGAKRIHWRLGEIIGAMHDVGTKALDELVDCHVQTTLPSRSAEKIELDPIIDADQLVGHHPDQPPETVVVLQSRAQGTGKTTLGNVMRRIFASHARAVSSKARLLSRFNADFDTVCWISGEEMLWAGEASLT
jgi:hypothetical protein